MHCSRLLTPRVLTSWLAALWLVVPALAGCGAEPGAASASCGAAEECDPTLCFEDTCMDADGDADGDGLTNRIELQLGTNPTAADTDQDGLGDGDEVGSPSAPSDTDGDGVIDALESAHYDGDCDGISDQTDPTDDPIRPDSIQVDLDADGELDTCLLDTDGDGLVDPLDCEPLDPLVSDTCPSPGLCTLGICVPGVGCASEPDPCDDQNFCTTDSCAPDEGGCVHVDFICDEDICTDDTCDPETGECLVVVKDCIDDLPCTWDEHCEEDTGECVSKPKDCNDDDPCTVDVCLPNSGICQSTPIHCDDGDPCTGDICDPINGLCLHVEIDCQDDDACTNDHCDSLTGECAYDASDCEDNDACTVDQCVPETGECLHIPKSCGDEVPCSDAICNSMTGQCDHIPIDCDDLDACTTNDCDETSGDCVHELITCSDLLHCTEDGCDPAQGCVFTPKVCEDDDPCTDGACLADNGACVFEEIPCDDDDPCTQDICQSDFDGLCAFTPISCDDDDPCTNDACDPQTGDCLHTAKPPATLTLASGGIGPTGLALWNTTDAAEAGAITGHPIPACDGAPSPYFIASIEHNALSPQSEGAAVVSTATSLEVFEAHIDTMGYALSDITARLGVGDQGADLEGADWTHDPDTGTETRHYYGVTLEIWLGDKPLTSSNLGTLGATIDHSICAPLPRPMTLESGWAYAIDLTDAASSDTQLAAQLLLQALGLPAKVRLTLDMTTDVVTPLDSEGRIGHLVNSVTGVLSGVACTEP